MQNKALKKFHMILSTPWRIGPKFLNGIGRSAILMDRSVAKRTGRLWGDTFVHIRNISAITDPILTQL